MARALTFDKFDAGIDLRKGATVTDANRMRDLLNCDVSSGYALVKRPGLRMEKALPVDQAAGLYAFAGELYAVGACVVNNCVNDMLLSKPLELNANLVVAGFPYLVVTERYYDQEIHVYKTEIFHFWLNNGQDSPATQVTDANCPQTGMAVTLYGKVFAPSPDGSTVRFSATNNPLDWTTADDAGFLPVSHHGGGRVTALAVYRGRLAVFTDSHVQIWAVDPDPALHRLEDITYGVGTAHPFSITQVSGDVLFMGFSGVRSLSQQSQSGNLTDLDIGSPVDDLAMAMLGRNPGKVVRGHYSQALGKFLLFVGAEALVYSFSRTSKLAAWSRWTLPGDVDGVAELDGATYVRIDDHIYRLDPALPTDNGAVFECYAEMGFMALKLPGSQKRLLGMDAVADGACDCWIGCDERNPERHGAVFRLEGDSRPLGTIPVELHGTAFSPRFRCLNNKPFRLDLLTFYYDSMGVR